jgi:predicted SAM-dependent methyltransferase
MAIVDKQNIIPSLDSKKAVVLDIGCGPLKKKPEWIGVDALDCEGVDIVGDIYEVLAAFPGESVDEVHSFHFFEHVPDVPLLLKELQRILKKGGLIEVVVPHFSNAYFYSDYTHKSFFGLYSFSYLVKDNIFKRRVPSYSSHIQLELKEVNLHFKSSLYINRPIRKVWQLLFNSSNLMKEWYEDSWSRNFPCYEIRFILIK